MDSNSEVLAETERALAVHPIHQLLAQLGIVIRKNEEIRKLTDCAFNMFRICDVAYDETTHSAILAELINPSGSNVLARDFLEAFLQRVCPNFDFGLSDYGVYTERSIKGGRRLDIFLEDSNKHAIAIENKLYAADQNEQLSDYKKWLEENFPKHNILLYLNLDGHAPGVNSTKDPDSYQIISYADQILEWLKNCVGIAAEYPIIRETIRQYITHLKSLTGDTMNEKYIDEFADIICADKINYETAQNIAACLGKFQEQWFNCFWHAFKSACGEELNIGGKLAKTKNPLDKSYPVFLTAEWNSASEVFRYGVFCDYNKSSSEVKNWVDADENKKKFQKLREYMGWEEQSSQWWLISSHRVLYPVDTPEFWVKNHSKSKAEDLGKECGTNFAQLSQKIRSKWNSPEFFGKDLQTGKKGDEK